jgi:predicted phosphodiesterase
MPKSEAAELIGRRAMLKQGTLWLAAGGVMARLTYADSSPDTPPLAVRFGLVTDLHHADKPPAGSRYYRETLGKLSEATEQFAKDKPDFLVELGDFIDAAESVDIELGYLKRINREFSAIADRRHYVLGNHCVDMLTKPEFLAAVKQDQSYYSFDQGGVHFILLDSCFRSDGTPYGRKNSQWTDANLPQQELDWLSADLKSASGPIVVFAHQRLDVAGPHSVKNAAAVRDLLERSGKVLAVFQGHSHENDYQDIAGIHYCTLAAMIEGSGPQNNGYSTVAIQPSGAIELTGFRRQQNRSWPVPSNKG